MDESQLGIQDAIIGCMATFSRRFEALYQVVASISPQLDRLYLYVNETTEALPSFESLLNVVVLDGRKYAGNISANGKIYPLRYAKNCLAFTLDDDSIYPPDYVSRYRAIFDCFDGECCVTTHGSIMPASTRWYYERYNVLASQRFSQYVQLASLAGSGTFAFSQKTFMVDPDHYLENVMVDLRLSLSVLDAGLPIWSVARPDAWLKSIPSPGLWEKYREGITHHTSEARRHNWSFETYRSIISTRLPVYYERRACGEADFEIDPTLLHAVESGGEPPPLWRGMVSTRMKRARYLQILADGLKDPNG